MTDDWHGNNLAGLLARNAAIRDRLAALVADAERLPVPPVPPNSAAEALAHALGLSAFEEQVVALCAAVAVDADVARLCATFNGDPTATHATLRLALDLFDGGHWSAFVPQGPLRALGVIELGAGSLLHAPTQIAERVLHALMGVPALDPVVDEAARLLSAEPMPPSRMALVAAAARGWMEALETVLQVRAPRARDAISVAAALCAATGRGSLLFDAPALLAQTAAGRRLRQAAHREAQLSQCVTVLLVDEPPAQAVFARFVERFAAPLIIVGDRPLPPIRRPLRVVDVPPIGLVERRAQWVATGLELSEAAFDQLACSFEPVSAPVVEALAIADDADARFVAVWDHCRAAARDHLGALVDVITPEATFADLVLGESQTDALHGLVRQVRHRYQVFGRWGARRIGASGGGVAALFAGPSGTGKTLAAEVIAHALSLDLYRVELNAVVSKYIGETEKNLHRIFEIAEESGAVLLFDEADALFGKRSEVRDVRDRYANLEVSYLLQRIERYRGLAILTTNLREAIDDAFLRRLRVVVSFPFPDRAQRARIWARQLPADAAYVAAVDHDALAGLALAGGTIRNVALDGLFHAAEAGGPVTMAHLKAAAIAEYARQGRPLTVKERWW